MFLLVFWPAPIFALRFVSSGLEEIEMGRLPPREIFGFPKRRGGFFSLVLHSVAFLEASAHFSSFQDRVVFLNQGDLPLWRAFRES